jgi:hypothetical protein
MDNNELETLSDKLDIIIKLLAFSITEGKPQPEQIRLLSSIGFQPKDIGQTLGVSANAVSVALSRMKKRKA